MKVGYNLNSVSIKAADKINFKGYKQQRNDYGQKEFEFNYVYDETQKDCYLEVFLVDKDENGNYYVTGERDNYGNVKPLDNYTDGRFALKLKSGQPTKVNMMYEFGLSPNQAFAYHYVLRPKDNPDGIPEYKIDYGNVINDKNGTQYPHRIYNVVGDSASEIIKGGAMKLILPDINNVAWVYDENNNIVPNPNISRARKTNKNIFNKIGGSLAGIEKDLDSGKLDNFTRIITTPLFTDDSLSSHAYWNKNCMQMAQSLGNINNYASVQRKMFAKGINLVSDGAYVNEGLEGVHFRHVLRWGKKSPYFNWFRISGLQDSPLSMGVFGKNIDFVTHRLVNSKYDFKVQNDGTVKISTNRKYDSNKPTYIQIYDTRLTDTSSLNDNNLLKSYNKLPESNLDINTHNDSIIPYSFVIDSEVYKQNAILLSNYNKAHKGNVIDLYSGEGTKAVAHFKFFNLDGKHESGFETWDANPDIAKLNYIPSNNETQNIKNILDAHERSEYKKLSAQKNMEVQDYAVTSAKYWTKKTNDILMLYIAQHLKDIDNKDAYEIHNKIKGMSDGKVFPKDLDFNATIIKNVINGRYELQEPDTEKEYDKAVLQGLMNLPLDSIEVGDDIVSVLASPYMTKRAINTKQIGVSRYDSYKNGNPHLTEEYLKAYKNTDSMYEHEMFDFAKSILDKVQDKLTNNQSLHNSSDMTTQFGKYVIPLLTAEIARFAVIKAVMPDAQIKYNSQTGEILYDYNETKSSSLLQMGIIADSPEDEAMSLTKKLKSGIVKISEDDKKELIDALAKSIKDTDYRSFALADMIIQRTGAGLDWRIDATKDIADIDSLKAGKTNYEYTMNKIIDFWSKFTKGVKQYHKSAYIAAELTDPTDIYNRGNGWMSGSRFSNEKEGVRKLINEAGFTTIANYDFLSSNITQIFGKLFDYDGSSSPDKGLIYDTLIHDKLSEYYTKEPLESIIYSYTFAGNHDKCRTLEGYAVDMSMVYEDLTESANHELRKRAYKILNGIPYGVEPTNDEISHTDFSRVSNLAIAKCESIASGIGKAKEKVGFSDDKKAYVYNTMLKALSNLSNGKFKGKTFEADGFGTKDFDCALDLVFDEMEYISRNDSRKLSKEERKLLKDKSFEFIVDPAVSKLLGHLKFLTALTGNPTLFSGDDYGSTGYETTTKNIYLQNRNIIREDWADKNSPDYKKFIDNHKKDIDEIFKLRKYPELQALNDGTPYVLDVHGVDFKKTIYSDFEGSSVDHDEYGKASISAILRQSSNGAMAVSLFNTIGINHNFDEYYRPAEITLSEIGLGSGLQNKDNVLSGLKNGIEFYDAKEINKPKNEKTVYITDNNKIKRKDGQPIKFQDSTMILYHPANVSFTGHKVLYNPQYNFVSNPYSKSKDIKIGSNINVYAG